MSNYERPKYLFEYVPETIIDKGADGFKRGPSGLLFAKAGNSYSLRFLTDPWNRDACVANGDWMCIRTVKTFNGLIGGGQFPREHRGTQIVFDQKVDERAGKRMTNAGWDPLIRELAPDTTSKYAKKDNPRVDVSDTYGINVIDDDGDHRILMVSRTAGRSLMRALEAKHEINKSVVAVGSSWLVNFVFSPGKGYEAIVKRLMVEDDISVDLPEPLNVFDFMVERRTRLDDWMELYKAGLASAEDDDMGDSYQSAQREADPEPDSVDLTETQSAPAKAEEAMPSPAKLKLLLQQAGIKVPARSDGDGIRALALEHGII